ncbi:MAG: helix-turn-helix domain-containing protein [Faecousia sp.]
MTEETLGKRIAAHRKRLGLTQDGLAEQLGVTAQAVSKWENDQSCPDITMLPKLVKIFEITTDELLGVERKPEPIPPVEPAPESQESTAQWRGNKVGVAIAIWLLLNGGLWIICEIMFHMEPSIWIMMLPTGALVFGIYGLLHRFSFFRLGCALFGGYFTYVMLARPRVMLNESLVLPILLMLFALELLLNSLRGRGFGVGHRHTSRMGENHCNLDGNYFDCATSFGEAQRVIQLPKLEGGTAEVNFGELRVDLRECGEIAEDCGLQLKCAFGSLSLYVPKNVRVTAENRTAFGAVQEHGTPNPEATAVLYLNCSVSFGEIVIEYL